MSERYTTADVLRWRQVDEPRIPTKLAQLEDPAFAGRRDFVLSGLQLLHEGLGYTFVALAEPERAKLHFIESGEYVARMFQLPDRGETVAPGRLSAGYSLSWLVALSIGADSLALELSAALKPEHLSGVTGQAEIEKFALALKSLISDNTEGALNILEADSPPGPSELAHYSDCLKAIAEKDEDQFLTSLGLASSAWSRHAIRAHRGLPQSVCFIHGLGLLRLAERILGRPLEFADEFIPSHFFSPHDPRGRV